jgi:hypothetical protein
MLIQRNESRSVTMMGCASEETMKRNFLALILAVSLCGCAAKQTITNAPAGVPISAVQSWDQATSTLAKIAVVTTNLRQVIISLNKATFVNGSGVTTQVFPDGPAYTSTLTAIGKIDQLQIQAANILAAQPQNWNQSTSVQIAALIQQIGQAIGQLTAEGLLGIKNPTSQTEVQSLITELTSLTSIIVSLT